MLPDGNVFLKKNIVRTFTLTTTTPLLPPSLQQEHRLGTRTQSRAPVSSGIWIRIVHRCVDSGVVLGSWTLGILSWHREGIFMGGGAANSGVTPLAENFVRIIV